MNGFASGSIHKADSQTNGAVKLEVAERASVSDSESEQNGRGRKKRRRGKAVQPVRSYPTRERAKAEAEVEAEVTYSLPMKPQVSSFSLLLRSLIVLPAMQH